MFDVAESQWSHSSRHSRLPDCKGELRAAPETDQDCDG